MPSYHNPLRYCGIARSTTRRRESILRQGINTDSRRRDLETGFLLEEIRRAEYNANGLTGHDGEVIGTGELCQTELQVANDIGVLDVLIALGLVGDGQVVWVALVAVRLADVVTSR